MKHHSLPFLLALSASTLFSAPPVMTAPGTTVPVAARAEQEKILATLLAGVNEIDAPGVPGIVSLTSEAAFPAVAGRVGKGVQESVVAAAVSGKTRIVALGHDGYLLPQSQAVADTAKLFDNAINWVSGGRKPTSIGVLADPAVVQSFKARGFNAVAVQSGALQGHSTLVINGHQLKESDFEALQKHLQGGGGLVIATTGWGWSWDDTSKTLARDFVGNKLLAPYGLVWAMGTLEKTSPRGFKVEPVTPLANAKVALRQLQGTAPISLEQSEQISSVIGNALTGLPPADTQLLPALKEIALNSTGEVVPFERAPVKLDRPKERLLLTLQGSLTNNAAPKEVKPHPAGAIFPGDVPPNAKPVTKSVKVDTSVPRWHSTGLYAAPGAPITVSLSDGTAPQGLGVRIGAHTDKLYHLDSWKRAPDISRSWPLVAGATQVANPFGGLIYVLVPDDAAAREVAVTISGGYEAPLYIHGVTSLADWKNTIRWAPGPWAEIVTDSVIVTVPSRALRDLEDPGPIAEYYQSGMDAAADLYAIPRRRTSPERIVADVQISAGYMHSGYPIMTWLDVEKRSVDLEALKKDPWGHWHEVGHNHQKREWTFEGTGEVTNNLLPLYVVDVIQKQPFEAGISALKPAERAARWAKYEAGGRQFKDWQDDPFLALEMYIQLQSAFGWEPFKKVFAQYEAMPAQERPQTEEQKRNVWMTRMARATGRNLGPFFEKWGVPTSAAARAAIADLPAWMPEFTKAP